MGELGVYGDYGDCLVRSHAFLFIGGMKIGHLSSKTRSDAPRVRVKCGSLTRTVGKFCAVRGWCAGGDPRTDPRTGHFSGHISIVCGSSAVGYSTVGTRHKSFLLNFHLPECGSSAVGTRTLC